MVSTKTKKSKDLEGWLKFGKECLRKNSMMAELKGWIAYGKALEIDPNNVEALFGAGGLCLIQEKVVDAKKHFRKILKMNAKDPNVKQYQENVKILQYQENVKKMLKKCGLS